MDRRTLSFSVNGGAAHQVAVELPARVRPWVMFAGNTKGATLRLSGYDGSATASSAPAPAPAPAPASEAQKVNQSTSSKLMRFDPELHEDMSNLILSDDGLTLTHTQNGGNPIVS